jgi:hypothetical protein
VASDYIVYNGRDRIDSPLVSPNSMVILPMFVAANLSRVPNSTASTYVDMKTFNCADEDIRSRFVSIRIRLDSLKSCVDVGTSQLSQRQCEILRNTNKFIRLAKITKNR